MVIKSQLIIIRYSCVHATVFLLQEVTVRLTWRRRDTINGNEATFTSRVAATVPFDTEPTNNADTRDIGFSVLADLAVTTV